MLFAAGDDLSCSCCTLLTAADKAVEELRATRVALYFALWAVLFLALGYLVLLMRGGPLATLPHIVREAVRICSVAFISAALVGLLYCAQPFLWPPKTVGMRERHLHPSVGRPD